jgi:hypothetical protein
MFSILTAAGFERIDSSSGSQPLFRAQHVLNELILLPGVNPSSVPSTF